jgi:hypothetical protein
MVDEKHDYLNLPIPTYEEATSSRPTSSQSRLGPEEVSDDHERQGLLVYSSRDDTPRRPSRYTPPTVESARSSLDFLPSSGENSARNSTDGLRREIEQMEVMDPEVETTAAQRSQFGQMFSKRITSLTNSFSFIHLPLRNFFPSFDFGEMRERQFARLQSNGCLLIGRLFGLFLIVSVVYIVFISDAFSMGGRRGMGQMYDPESVRIYVQDHINETNIREHLKYVTGYPHIAGTEGNYILGQWVEGVFAAAGLEDVHLERFDVYLNYPKEDGRRIAIIDPPELAWTAKIEEDLAYQDRKQTAVFHGHSRAGNVTGPLIYANYGSREDFKSLADKGINLNGSIALVRYYGTQGDRALKVKAAELAGAVGCIIYSDPAQDGFVQGKPWPEGRYMPKDGVQRGAVSLMSWIIGDVLSPGFASTPGEKKRISTENNPGLNNIPSLPIAWRDAQKLLQALKGHGQKVPKEWIGGVPDVEWWSGDQSSPVVHLMNEQDEEKRQAIYNVIGSISGVEQSEKKIVVGNHRDAWCFGAADPGSGTAVMLEVARIFGELRHLGWRPLRTIEFASWDGEEYNLIGSTEHVENRIDQLRRDGVAYVNVDVAISGEKFEAAASPLFEKILLRILDRTSDPVRNATLRTLWDHSNSKLEGLGAGSDYVAFQDLAGTSSIDLRFGGGEDAIFPYHSCYDNFEWMDKFGDPNFQFHKVLGQIWALMILELADRPIIPFDMEAYASAIQSYVDDLRKFANDKGAPWPAPHPNAQEDVVFTLDPLYQATQYFRRVAADFQRWENGWTEVVYGSGGYESTVMAIHRMSHNTRMSNFETDLLDLEDGGGVGSPLLPIIRFANIPFSFQVEPNSSM